MTNTITPKPNHHQVFFNKKATDKQLHFYGLFPQYRGISDNTLDTELLEAVFVAALTFGNKHDRVCLFLPVKHEAWGIEQLNLIADKMFTRCALETENRRREMAKAFGLLFNKVWLTGNLLRIPQEPLRWVSFGFSITDPLPDWMPDKLYNGKIL